MHTIEFDIKTEQELSRLATLGGKDIDQLIKEAVLEYLQDFQDAHDAETVLRRIEQGDESVISLDDLERRLDALDG